ncbi:MAG: type IV pilus modification PilV family protein [Planctomycetota bacterium]
MRNATGGFTMVELMIAVAVLAVAIMGTLSAFVAGGQLTALSREDSVAQQVVEREMARLRANGYAWLDGNQAQTTGFIPALNRHEQLLLEAPRTDGLSQGQRTIGKDGNLIVIAVRVNWFSTAVGREISITREAKVAP